MLMLLDKSRYCFMLLFVDGFVIKRRRCTMRDSALQNWRLAILGVGTIVSANHLQDVRTLAPRDVFMYACDTSTNPLVISSGPCCAVERI